MVRCWRSLTLGPLYAVVDEDDDYHSVARATLERAELRLVIPALVVAEVTYMVGRRLGPSLEADFLRGLEGFDVHGPAPEDFLRMADLVEQYGDFPLGGTDASVIALAERLGTHAVVTFDRRHSAAVRPQHCRVLYLLPESIG